MNLNAVLKELQNENKCTIINSGTTSLIEVTEAQLENFRIQKSDVCFDVKQEIKIRFPGEFEAELAYVDEDSDYKETVYGLYIIYKENSLQESIQGTVGEFAKMKNIDAKEFSNFLKSTYDWARHAEVWTMVGFDTLEKCFVDFKNRLSEECTSAEFQRAAPGKVITMNFQSSKKKLGKKDKYNKLGEGLKESRFIERKRKTPEGYFARKALANRKRLEEGDLK
jgi:hypothetical protein